MRSLLPLICAAALASCASTPVPIDPRSDEPDVTAVRRSIENLPSSYANAVAVWRSPMDVNAWVGARFEYDSRRAMRLSENQRAAEPMIRIHEPHDFYERPTGVCVDLARFAVETLRAVAPAANAAYLMIEFDPAVIAGNTLRRHWVARYEQEGQLYFFADSKRPGHVAGPYHTTQQFIDDYARYRQRRIVAFRMLESYERKVRQKAPRATREQV